MVGISGVGVYATIMLRNSMIDTQGKLELSSAQLVSEEIEHEIDDRFRSLQFVANRISGGNLASIENAQSLLEQHKDLQFLFNAGIFVTDLDGKIVASVPASIARVGRLHPDREAVASAIKSRVPVVGAPITSNILNKPTVNLIVPVLGKDAKVVGTLSGVLSLVDDNFLQKIVHNGFGENGSYVLVAPKHRRVLASSITGRIFAQLPPDGENLALDRHKGNFQGTDIFTNPSGIEVLASIDQISNTDWYVAVSIPLRSVLSPIYDLQARMIMITVLFMLVSGVLIWWLLKIQLSPIKSTVKALTELAHEDRVATALPVARNDEIGGMVAAFNVLLANLANREAALSMSSARYQVLIDWSPEAIAVHRNGTILYANPSAIRLIGANSQLEVVGRRIAEIVHPDFHHVVHDRLNRYKEEGDNIPKMQIKIVNMDGQLVDVEIQTKNMQYMGELAYFTAVTDISEFKAITTELLEAKSQAENASRAKSTFLAAVSHQLRQPVTAISIFLGALKNADDSARDGILACMQSSVDNLSPLLADLLDVSRLEAGVVKPKLMNFSIDELVSKIVVSMQPKADAKGLDLRVHTTSQQVCSDQSILDRILYNFVDNAIKYSETGGVLIACRRSKGKLWLEVWDTGIGIQKDNLKSIFGEFTRLRNDDDVQGSGLGLAIVSKMAGLLHAEIRIASVEGKGSMFAVELFDQPDQSGIVPSKVHGDVGLATPGKELTVAIVEDNLDVLNALTIALQMEGHKVFAHTSSSNLMQALGTSKPDIIVSDFRLSSIENGFDVINLLRARFGTDLPAFIMTGDTDPAMIREFADKGIAILYKPLDVNDFFNCLWTTIGQSKATPAT
jgi:PAS domain S-box-containing protein